MLVPSLNPKLQIGVNNWKYTVQVSQEPLPIAFSLGLHHGDHCGEMLMEFHIPDVSREMLMVVVIPSSALQHGIQATQLVQCAGELVVRKQLH